MSTKRGSAFLDVSAIEPLLERLRAHFNPQEIWLFGSRARGTATANSDWDLCAIVRDDANAELFDPTHAWGLLRADDFGADVVVFPRGEFEEQRGTPNTIPIAVAAEGLRLEEARLASSVLLAGDRLEHLLQRVRRGEPACFPDVEHGTKG